MNQFVKTGAILVSLALLVMTGLAITAQFFPDEGGALPAVAFGGGFPTMILGACLLIFGATQERD